MEAKVKDRLPWIIKQRKYFERFLPPETPRQYVSGETHKYLGRQYRLKIRSSETDLVTLKGKFFLIYSRDKSDREHNKELLRQQKVKIPKHLHTTVKKRNYSRGGRNRSKSLCDSSM